mmetsp:Transcript_16751/g.31087  ORF Transcript_16751/g.31087 Transcript_16751/m.31087 type:complete len:349 (-) Transcript_16751:181-1227(-)
MTLKIFIVAFVVLACTSSSTGLEQHVRRLGRHAHLRTGNHTVKKPSPASNLTAAAGLAALAANCSCSFKGVCSCEEAMEFMKCIKDHCNSGKCMCEGHHFLDACQAMDTTCPKVGLVCSEEKATCPTAALNATASTPPVVQTPAPAAKNTSIAPTVVQTEPASGATPMYGGSSLEKMYLANLKDIVMANVVYVLLSVCVAYIYNKTRSLETNFFFPGKRRLRKQEKSFAGGNGLFSSVLSDPKLFLFSFFCGPVRWADTVDRANLSIHFKYWFAYVSMLLLLVLSDHTLGIAYLCLVGMGVEFRQRLRGRGNCQTIFQDILAWFFCSPCAIAQEAREEAHSSYYSFDA